MRRRILAAVALAAFLAVSAPAGATCRPGYIGFRNGKPVVEPPRCDTFPR